MAHFGFEHDPQPQWQHTPPGSHVDVTPPVKLIQVPRGCNMQALCQPKKPQRKFELSARQGPAGMGKTANRRRLIDHAVHCSHNCMQLR
eukprot:7349907-Prymnesium_polylepis.1